jgi:hypothetical protein
MNDTLHDVTRWPDRSDRIAIAMVVGAVRSAPRPLGTNVAVNDRGEISGRVSGGCVEGAVVEIAERVISSLLAQHPRLIVADLVGSGRMGLGSLLAPADPMVIIDASCDRLDAGMSARRVFPLERVRCVTDRWQRAPLRDAGRGARQAPTRRRTTGLTASRLEGTPERMVAEEW